MAGTYSTDLAARFYKNLRVEHVDDTGATVVVLDNGSWPKLKTISLDNLTKSLQISANIKVSPDRNVSSLEFNDQDEFPLKPPTPTAVVNRTFMAVDENYLYVWVNDKWKRTPLSSW